MKKTNFIWLLPIFLLILTISFCSCTDTNEQLGNYSTVFRNASLQTLTIKGFDNQNNLVFENIVNSLENGQQCNYDAEVFLGFSCQADSLIFKFDNDKGFICVFLLENNNFCFLNKNPYDSTDYESLGNNNFQFTITQQDFENAFELPE